MASGQEGPGWHGGPGCVVDALTHIQSCIPCLFTLAAGSVCVCVCVFSHSLTGNTRPSQSKTHRQAAGKQQPLHNIAPAAPPGASHSPPACPLWPGSQLFIASQRVHLVQYTQTNISLLLLLGKMRLAYYQQVLADPLSGTLIGHSCSCQGDGPIMRANQLVATDGGV